MTGPEGLFPACQYIRWRLPLRGGTAVVLSCFILEAFVWLWGP